LKENKTENVAIFTQKVYISGKNGGKNGVKSSYFEEGGRKEKKTEIAIFRQKRSSKLPKYTENPKLFFLLSSLTCSQI
jgi:hypothetical protein